MNIPTRLWGVKKPRNVICSLTTSVRHNHRNSQHYAFFNYQNGITLRDVMNLQSENHEKLEG